MRLFPYLLVKTCIVGAQKSHLIETVLMSTHNICYGTKIRKNNFQVYTIIWGPKLNYIYNRTPLDMHNVLSQGHNNYQTRRKNPLVNKGINIYTITTTKCYFHHPRDLNNVNRSDPFQLQYETNCLDTDQKWHSVDLIWTQTV